VSLDERGRIAKVHAGGAVRAALDPTHALYKAGAGGVSGAKDFARGKAIDTARQKFGDLYAGQASTPALGTSSESAGYGDMGSWGQAENTPAPIDTGYAGYDSAMPPTQSGQPGAGFDYMGAPPTLGAQPQQPPLEQAPQGGPVGSFW
jgi:hypothetical protein